MGTFQSRKSPVFQFDFWGKLNFSDPETPTQSQLYQNNLSIRTNQTGQKSTETIDIVPNPVFKAIIKNSLSKKKLLELSEDRTFCIDIFEAMTQTSCDLLRNIEDFMQNIA